MHAALMRAFEGRPPCTVRVIVEGEEEWGGPFAEYPRANPHLFASDAIVVADVGNARINEPTFTTALRGMGAVTVECRTLQGSVHSGMFGGPAPDALMALIGLLATMRDGNGDTCIDGIEGFDWDGPEFAEADFRELAGVEPDQPLVGTGSIASRLFSKPVINVTGIDAPATEGAINAVIPFARARVSLRVPPDQDATAARAALIRHLQTRAPWGVKVSVIPEAVDRRRGFDPADRLTAIGGPRGGDPAVRGARSDGQDPCPQRECGPRRTPAGSPCAGLVHRGIRGCRTRLNRPIMVM
ncbi:MAG: peptidase dimerization domain-containing protein, partial [Candidatus Nanopelagicales bacterium]|nr:peptidase dimerization domain-containing protein [Candidatus Nanopelagicales bacterium]